MNITVLYGGDSPEREVSLRSGARVGAALRTLGHTVRAFDYRAGSLPGSFLLRLREADAVFLALHGGDGEDGRLQARLEDAGIFHYTGSGAHAAALAMDKNRALCVARERGVPVPIGGIWQEAVPRPRVPFPAIIKPVSGVQHRVSVYPGGSAFAAVSAGSGATGGMSAGPGIYRGGA